MEVPFSTRQVNVASVELMTSCSCGFAKITAGTPTTTVAAFETTGVVVRGFETSHLKNLPEYVLSATYSY